MPLSGRAVSAPRGTRPELDLALAGGVCSTSTPRHTGPCHARSRDVCKTENPTRDTTHGGAGRKAPSSLCRKRPFTTHADRRRSRLKGGRLPVAGPVARRAAGRWRRRRPRLRRLFASGVRDGARQLPARAPDGRRDRRLEARPPRPQPHPPGQHRAGPVDPRRGPTGAHRTKVRRSTPPPLPAAALAEFERS